MIEPKLRFKKDNGNSFPDLEKRKLGESIRFINGRAYKQDELLKSGKYLVLRVGNLFTNDSYYYSDLELDDDKYIEDGNLIYAWSATFGPRIYHGKKCIYHYHIWKLEFDENIISKMFLNYYLLYDVEKIKSQRTGGTMVHITKNAMEHRELYFPSLPEQQKIADFLSTVDTVISNYNDTIKAWKDRKKGVMQKLFSQEVRFKADDGSEFPEWEEKNVEDVCSVSTGKGNTQDKVDTGAYRFYVRSPIIEHSDSYLFDEEAVITVGDGVGTGKVFHYVKGKYNLHQRCYRMYDFRGVTGKYFYYFFSTNFYRRVKSMSAKTSVDSVRMEMITKMKILVPCLAEQQKIADCLSSLDEVIKKQKTTLAAWEELKKGLLQQMFV